MNVPQTALNIDLVTTTTELAALCERLAHGDYVTVDTEFMRENTFWPRLCLIQVGGAQEARAIDPSHAVNSVSKMTTCATGLIPLAVRIIDFAIARGKIGLAKR